MDSITQAVLGASIQGALLGRWQGRRALLYGAMLGTLPDLSSASLQMICGLVVTTMLNAASDILDLPPGQPKQERELVVNFVRQLRLVFLGATRWRED